MMDVLSLTVFSKKRKNGEGKGIPSMTASASVQEVIENNLLTVVTWVKSPTIGLLTWSLYIA
jgi:hypothetical protein